MTKNERARVAAFALEHEALTYHQIAALAHCSHSTITRICGEFGIKRGTGPKMERTQSAGTNANQEESGQ
jgi:DNA-binding MurR/RpiR family transcriptional regulator